MSETEKYELMKAKISEGEWDTVLVFKHEAEDCTQYIVANQILTWFEFKDGDRTTPENGE